jgi:lipid-A-disaccharide synthase
MADAGKILIVAGEASADLHGAALVEHLQRLRPGIKVYGVGGRELARVGAHILHDFSGVGVVGIGEVLPRVGEFYRVHKQLVKGINQEKPDLVLLLDLPDFNLYLARKIKARNPSQPILYYISPQVWAWRRGRVKLIKQRIDKMLVIFPFEEEFYKREGVPVEFVGHPLSDRVRAGASPEELRRRFVFENASHLIALLPGSRPEENKLYIPAMTGAVSLLLEYDPGIRFLVAVAPTVSRERVEAGFRRFADKVRLVQAATYDVLAASDLAVVASGTATLETALLGIPMIILARTSLLNYVLARPLIKVNRYGLPNLIAGRDIVPELVMRKVNPDNIFREAKNLLEDHARYQRMKKDLEEVRQAVSVENASGKAAEAVIKFLEL